MKKHWVKTLLDDREAVRVPEAVSELIQDVAYADAVHAPTHAPAGSDPLPVMVASGSSHAVGQTPDTSATAGSRTFLRETATWVAPPIDNYAEMFGTDLASLVLTTAGVWYLCPALTAGEVRAYGDIHIVTSAERADVTVSMAGLFLLNVHASIITEAVDLLHMGIFKGGVLVDKLVTSLKADKSEEAFSITGLLAIKYGDVYEVKFMGGLDGTAVVVKHIDFNIVQIGW